MPVIFWKKVSTLVGVAVPFLPFLIGIEPPPPPPPNPNGCISKEEVAKFIGLPAVVYTVDDTAYSGILEVNDDSDTPIALFTDGCCDLTLLDYCDVESIISPPCPVFAAPCCQGCLPSLLKITFSNPTGNCTACSLPVTLFLGANQFGQYTYVSNFNPFGNCGGNEMAFSVKFACDGDYKDWGLQIFWGDVCVGSGAVFIDNCSTMSASFTIYISCDTVCKGSFQADVIAN